MVKLPAGTRTLLFLTDGDAPLSLGVAPALTEIPALSLSIAVAEADALLPLSADVKLDALVPVTCEAKPDALGLLGPLPEGFTENCLTGSLE